MIIKEIPLFWVHKFESVIMNLFCCRVFFIILLPIVMKNSSWSFIYCGYRLFRGPNSIISIDIESLQSVNRNELVSLVALVHFVFSDCLAHSISECAVLFIFSCFNFWKCTHFCINMMLNDQLWKYQHSRCVCTDLWFWSKNYQQNFNSIFHWIVGFYYLKLKNWVKFPDLTEFFSFQ